MRKKKEMCTELLELFTMETVDYSIYINKEMDTVFGLSYFLIDFQAIVNGLYEIIIRSGEISYAMVAEPVSYYKEEERTRNPEELEHLNGLQDVERKMVKAIDSYTREKVTSLIKRKYIGYKQTTSRNFNKKYRDVWKLRSFGKGSLILDITSSIICYFITEFLQKLLQMKTGRDDIININIYNNVIIIDKNEWKIIPNNDKMIVPNLFDDSRYNLNVKKWSDEILSVASPDDDVEESIRRFISVLQENGIVSENVIYDARGIKTIVRDVNRMMGNFVDIRI